MELFPKTKERINTAINDRVTAPITTALIISCAAFLLAGLALIVANGSKH